MTSRLGRRQFLRGAAGTTIALPVLDSLAPRATRAAGPAPKRFIAFATVLGSYPERFWPRAPGTQAPPPEHVPQRHFATGVGDAETTSFELAEITQPLSPHQKDLIFVEGLNRANTSGHGGYCNMLSGVTGPEEIGHGITLDQKLAQRIGGGTKFASLQIGVQNGGTGKYECLSWYGAQKPAPAEPDPVNLYTRVFSEVPDGSAEGNAALKALMARRKSVLDSALSQAKSLRTRVGTADREKLDNYFDSVRQVEERLTRIQTVTGCQKPTRPAVGGGTKKDLPIEATPEIAAAQIQLLAMAFACDLTRVATLQIGHEGSNMTHPWLGVPIRHHDLSHTKPDAADYVQNYKWITAIGTWHAEQLASLIGQLKQMSDGEGAVWDNTLVLWMNGLTWGCFHSDEQLPVVLAGSAGGHFKTGRHVRFSREKGAKIATTNDLLLQVQRAFGMDEPTFGDPAFHGRPMDALKG